jgi:sialic acid synthase SpsE
MYNIPVGFSDHTTDLLSSKVAIIRGANVVERHFTLNKKMEGPDHILSSDKNEMLELVKTKKLFNKWKSWKKNSFKNTNIKESTELLLGDGVKKIQPNEYITINSQKKSLFAKKKIRKGELFSKDNLCIKGPVAGLMPKYYEIIIGRKAKKNIESDHPITWENI